MIKETKIKVGRIRKPGKLIYKKDRIFFKFGYWPALNDEIKAMEGHRWHGYEDPPIKMWSVAQSQRNEFQLARLMGLNPYEPYDLSLKDFDTERPLYGYQREMVSHVLTRKKCVLACEMGTGKTLVFIEAIEHIDDLKSNDVWYVGPRSGVTAVGMELSKWECKLRPRMFTYEGMRKELENWNDGDPAPRVVCFDESSKLKTPTSKRSKAALALANAIREEHGDRGYVILMSGTPAPKTPIDWWQQCEVACPGFLKEGTVGKFKKRLCLVEMRESTITGGVYPHIITWLDDERKCVTCGSMAGDPCHAPINYMNENYHEYKASKNEVLYLYERMNGLVMVKFKKDCLDLPEKRYEVIRIKPTVELLRAAKLIKSNTDRAITALTLLRELSDGFQYVEKVSGKKTCSNCNGKKTVVIKVPLEMDKMAPNTELPEFEDKEMPCDNCGATGEVSTYNRDTDAVGSPKDEYFKQDLEDHEDVGRYIVWGGFTGTLDRLVQIAHQQGWATLRVDGKGYIGESAHGEPLDSKELFFAMDRSHPRRNELLQKYPKLVMVGHPQAGGMAFTFTASPTELFYSNCFNGEARMQAEDRGHRPGMDSNRGLVIKDLIMFDTDLLVLENLRKKKKLQNLTMGQLHDAFVGV